MTIDIGTAGPEEIAGAFEIALGGIPEEDRLKRVIDLLLMTGIGAADPRGMFVARQEGLLVGAFYCVAGAGGAALAWLPRWKRMPSDADADRLIAAGMNWLRSRGTRVTQVATVPAERGLHAPLWRAGFRSVGPLVSLHHSLDDLPMTWQLTTRTVAEVGDEVFGSIVAATYQESLDFPELNGRRSMSDVLAGHRAVGKHRPGHWKVVYADGEFPVGVVLLANLADHERFGVWELSYLGVVPRFRRRGWGRKLLIEALRTVSEEHGEQLEVAVDGRNEPAVQLYESMGFRLVDERAVSLHFFTDSVSGSESPVAPPEASTGPS